MEQGPVQFREGRSAPDRAAPEITLAGQRVRLMPQRVAHWVDRATLIVADLHLGKGEALGAGGVPIPAGLLERQLATLHAAIVAARPGRVVVVGDLLHAPAGLTPEMVATVERWRAGVDCEIVVVPGNHDRRLAEIAPRWRMTLTGWQWADGPFTFRHGPVDAGKPPPFLWHAHLHPAVRISAGGDSLRLPCFHVGTRRAVLPAFSPFTVGGPLPRLPDDRVFAIAEGRVVEV